MTGLSLLFGGELWLLLAGVSIDGMTAFAAIIITVYPRITRSDTKEQRPTRIVKFGLALYFSSMVLIFFSLFAASFDERFLSYLPYTSFASGFCSIISLSIWGLFVPITLSDEYRLTEARALVAATDGENSGIFGEMLAVSKDAERLGVLAQEHYKSISATIFDLHACGAVMWRMDSEGYVTYSKGGGLKVWGLNNDQAKGSHISEFPDPSPCFAALRVFESGDYRHLHYHSDNSMSSYTVISAHFDARGKFSGIIGVTIPLDRKHFSIEGEPEWLASYRREHAEDLKTVEIEK